MKIQATNNYVIIRAERKPTGIVRIVTEQYNEKLDWLKEKLIAHSVGSDVKNIKVGDRVILGTNKVLREMNLAEIMGENNENVAYFIGKEEDIAATLS